MIWNLVRKAVTSEYLAFVLRIAVGGFFIYASMSKIPYPAQFAEATANYRLVPFWLLNVVAVMMPWIEFVSGLFLIIGFMSRGAATLIASMLVAFNVMVLINMYWGAPITCGCYDTVGEPIGWKKIIENGILLIFTLQVFYFDKLFLFRRGSVMANLGARVASPPASR